MLPAAHCDRRPLARPERIAALALPLVLASAQFASACAGGQAGQAPAAAASGPAAAASGPAAGMSAEAAALTARLDSLFAATYRAGEPGAAVRVQRGEEVLLRKAYGLADMELDVPIAPEMVFHLCSITKQFTAVAVLILAAEGKIDLDAPLGRYLPKYPQPGAAASIHELLTHTAGIPEYTSEPGFWRVACQDRELDDLIATWKDKPLDFSPGTDWSYSNSGYVLLGKVIEVVSGRDYPRFLEERIFQPLQLEHTAYGDAARLIHGRVRGYDWEGDSYRNTPCVSLSLAYAAGGLLADVDDLITWMAALFRSEQLLTAEWRDRLHTPAVLHDGRSTFYACGLEIHTLAGHPLICHGGGGGGFTSFAGFVSDADLTIAVLSNRAGAGPSPQALAQRALALVLGAPPEGRTRLDLSHAIEIRDSSLLDALEGRYELAPGFYVDVRRAGEVLWVQPTGQPALRIHPRSTSCWFPLEIDAVIEFQGFGDGRADALVLSQDGRRLLGRRVE